MSIASSLHQKVLLSVTGDTVSLEQEGRRGGCRSDWPFEHDGYLTTRVGVLAGRSDNYDYVALCRPRNLENSRALPVIRGRAWTPALFLIGSQIPPPRLMRSWPRQGGAEC